MVFPFSSEWTKMWLRVVDIGFLCSQGGQLGLAVTEDHSIDLHTGYDRHLYLSIRHKTRYAITILDSTRKQSRIRHEYFFSPF